MREREYLGHRYRAILSYTGMILAVCSILMMSPLLVMIFYPQEGSGAAGFITPAILMGGIGSFIWWKLRPKEPTTLTILEGGVIVLLSWITVILFSAWPFIQITSLNFTQALFESMSGWTTTGLSVVDVESADHTILLWRSITQYAGGAGFAIIMMSAIIGPVGVGLSTAEGRSEQLLPNVRKSARLVLIIYVSYTLAGIVGLWLAGMPIFDAINHSFATVSTGGFSTRVDSIGYYQSVAIEAVTIALMLISGISFITAWFLWQGKFEFVFRNGEIRLISVLIPVPTILLLIFTCKELYPSLGESSRVALFQAVTAISTTGFSTVGFTDWNSFGIMTIVVLMIIGGGTCSTAGGIKQFRIYALLKMIGWEIKRQIMPRTSIIERPLWVGDRQLFVDNTYLVQISTFVFIYLLTFAAGTLILCMNGFSLRDSIFEFASALGTVGLSIGVTTPDAPVAVLWTEIFAMFLGRLEFFVIITGLMKFVKDMSLLAKK